ncbi:MAG TPA: cation diffusion facilitator family transporter [Rhodocyclaceae bacterium]|nr:cation diffusion facilitator family transporter [Rhodocyclaceae bacterium]
MTHESLARYAWLSIAAALATILLKGLAWWLTGSVGLLSDALESFVNLAGAIVTLLMLGVAALPEDDNHAFGHTKAEYFASGFEGVLILLAAAAIAVAATDRLIHPQPLQQVGAGLAVSVVASLINFGVARVLLRAGRRYHSIALEADAHHLMTDVWTSAGVLVGVAAVAATGWQWLDPLLALAVAANIVWTGWKLLQRSAEGLMDAALPAEQHQVVVQVLERHRGDGLDYHALRTRQAGARQFVSVHVLVPGAWTVARGHDLAERIEVEIRDLLPRATVTTHIEPLEDAASWHDVGLDRQPQPVAKDTTS